MPNPLGALPKDLVHLDDEIVLELQACTDTQVLNTAQMLDYMKTAESDGVIELAEWRYVRRHVRLEDELNHDSESLVKWMRVYVNRVTDLVQGLRARIQEAQKKLKAAS